MSVVGIDGAEIVWESLPDWIYHVREEYERAGRVKQKHFRIWELRRLVGWSWAKIVQLIGMNRDWIRKVVRQVERRIRQIVAEVGAEPG